MADSKKPTVSVPRATRRATAWDRRTTGVARAPRPCGSGGPTVARSTPFTDHGKEVLVARREPPSIGPDRSNYETKPFCQLLRHVPWTGAAKGRAAGREGAQRPGPRRPRSAVRPERAAGSRAAPLDARLHRQSSSLAGVAHARLRARRSVRHGPSAWGPEPPRDPPHLRRDAGT